MHMTEGQIYCCQNLRCGCEIKVVKTSIEANSNPRCCCGSEMKKPYTKPAVRKSSLGLESFARSKTHQG